MENYKFILVFKNNSEKLNYYYKYLLFLNFLFQPSIYLVLER